MKISTDMEFPWVDGSSSSGYKLRHMEHLVWKLGIALFFAFLSYPSWGATSFLKSTILSPRLASLKPYRESQQHHFTSVELQKLEVQASAEGYLFRPGSYPLTLGRVGFPRGELVASLLYYFVVDRSYRLLMHESMAHIRPDDPDWDHMKNRKLNIHSLSNGWDVLLAGQMLVQDGKVIALSDYTDDFYPQAEETLKRLYQDLAKAKSGFTNLWLTHESLEFHFGGELGFYPFHGTVYDRIQNMARASKKPFCINLVKHSP